MIFGEEAISKVSKKTGNGGKSLVHLVVNKSLTKLTKVSFPDQKKAHEEFDKYGCNPLHFAVLTNNTIINIL